MRRPLTLLALMGCEPDAVVIYPDAGPALSRVMDVAPSPADVPLAFDIPRDLALPSEVVSFDPDGGEAPRCGSSARLEEPGGDYIVVGNRSGGRFVVEVDAAVRAVGVIAAGPVTLHITGAQRDALQRVLLVGPEAQSAAVTGFDLARVDRVTGAPAPSLDAEGVPTMQCAAGCDGLHAPREVGCNSRAQVLAFFVARLGEGRRWALLQSASLDGLRVRTSAGGCCLP